LVIALIVVSQSLLVSAASAQVRRNEKCPQPAYPASQVTKQARVVEGPDFSGVAEVFQNIRGMVKLDAVICRSGDVTDIKVVENTVPPSALEFVVAAVSIMRFMPAELNFHSVAQKTQFEFEINNGQIKQVSIVPSNGQGNFSKASRVFTEKGLRGGIAVNFELTELPLIGDITFKGLMIDPSIIKEAWHEAHVKMKTGAPDSPETNSRASQIIKQVLDRRAVPYTKVELRLENVTSQKVNLTFVIIDR